MWLFSYYTHYYQKNSENRHARLVTEGPKLRCNTPPLERGSGPYNTVTENIKRLTESGFYYHTSSDSWYPPPAQTIFSSLPKLKKSKQKNIKPEEAQALRDWVA